MTMNRRSALVAATAFAAAPALRAQAPKWPDKTLRIIVPYPPGGSSDIIARAISQPLSDAPKQTVIVENKAGANGNVGAEFVAKAALGRRGAGTRQWTDLKPEEMAQLADLIAKVGGQ